MPVRGEPMTAMTVVSPGRTRFRRFTAAIAALGVVAFGLVPVTAATAAPMPVTITVHEVGGDPISAYFMVRTDLTGPPVESGTSNVSGVLSLSLEPGTYYLFATPDSPYSIAVTPI